LGGSFDIAQDYRLSGMENSAYALRAYWRDPSPNSG
jgi:hypothetical protein